MKIDPKPKMTKTKQYRTDEEYLQMLSDRHPVIGMILEYRGCASCFRPMSMRCRSWSIR